MWGGNFHAVVFMDYDVPLYARLYASVFCMCQYRQTHYYIICEAECTYAPRPEPISQLLSLPVTTCQMCVMCVVYAWTVDAEKPLTGGRGAGV